MNDTGLLQIFQNVNDTLCRYDYYIHTSKLVAEIVKVNLKFGIYHTIDMLNDGACKMYG